MRTLKMGLGLAVASTCLFSSALQAGGPTGVRYVASASVVFQVASGVRHRLVSRVGLAAGPLMQNVVVADGVVDSTSSRQLAVAWNESCGALQDVADRKDLACLITNEQGRYPVRFALSNPDASDIVNAGLLSDAWYGQGYRGELRYGVQALGLGSRAEGIYHVAINAAAYER